jgi:hypothetical protein
MLSHDKASDITDAQHFLKLLFPIYLKVKGTLVVIMVWRNKKIQNSTSHPSPLPIFQLHLGLQLKWEPWMVKYTDLLIILVLWTERFSIYQYIFWCPQISVCTHFPSTSHSSVRINLLLQTRPEQLLLPSGCRNSSRNAIPSVLVHISLRMSCFLHWNTRSHNSVTRHGTWIDNLIPQLQPLMAGTNLSTTTSQRPYNWWSFCMSVLVLGPIYGPNSSNLSMRVVLSHMRMGLSYVITASSTWHLYLQFYLSAFYIHLSESSSLCIHVTFVWICACMHASMYVQNIHGLC